MSLYIGRGDIIPAPVGFQRTQTVVDFTGEFSPPTEDLQSAILKILWEPEPAAVNETVKVGSV